MAFYRCNLEQDTTLGTKNIVENGTYLAQSDNLDGYSQVSVNAPTPIVQGNNVIPPIASAEDILVQNVTRSGESLEMYESFFTLDEPLALDGNTYYVAECDMTMNIEWLYSNHFISVGLPFSANWVVGIYYMPSCIFAVGGSETRTVHFAILFRVINSGNTVQNIMNFNINNATVGAWSMTNGRIYKVSEVISPYPTDKPTWFETTDLVVDADTESLVVHYDTTRRLVFALVYNASNAFGERNYTEMIQVAKNRSHQPEENKFYKFNGITDYRGYESPDSYGGVSVDETSGTVTFNARGNGYIWRGGRTYRVLFVYDSNPVTPTEE